MTDLVSSAQLKSIFPKIDLGLLVPINETLAKYQINTKMRKAAFLAQTGHESANFSHFSENLNYSAQGLRTIFGKYFKTDTLAAQYARKPEMIANVVYANRMGNGPTATGDGWNFRGRGAIQLTGKDTYMAFGKSFGMKTLGDVVEFLSTPRGAIISAGWYWDSRALNKLADTNDMVTITKKINGGTNGLDERQHLYHAALAVL